MRDLFFVGLTIGLSVLILFRPWWGIIAWTVFGLINPQELTYHSQSFRFALLLGGATLIGLFLTKERRSMPLTTQTTLVILLAAWVTVTTIFAWAPAAAWDQWDKVIKILGMALVTTMLIYGRKRVTVLLVTLVIALGFFGVKGGIFTILTGGVHRVNGPGEGAYISGNSGIGVALLMILPLMLVMAQDQTRKWARLAIWGSFWLTVLATIFTYSRGALLGLAAVIFMLFFKARRKALVLLVIVPLAFAAYQYVPEQLISRAETIQTYQEDGSAMGRIQAWGVAWNVALSHPFGAGFGFDTVSQRWMGYANFSDDHNLSHARAAHSNYFQVLGEHGLVGFGLWLLLLVSTYRALGRLRKTVASIDGGSQQVAQFRWLGRYAMAIQVALVGYAVSGAFLSVAYFDLFFVYVALTAVMRRECAELLAQRRDVAIETVPAVRSHALS
jgi:probable O-glycosylation ligase (exosortase A-associated)